MDELSFEMAFGQCPLVAILRGLPTADAADVGEALVAAGFSLIEVPLNSPDPLPTIARLAKSLEGRALVGAGTVLSPDQVRQVRDHGGQFVVSPNTDPATIATTRDCGMASVPGFFTVSEAFAALRAGASALKLFPAAGLDPAILAAQRAVLENDVKVLAVGGITATNMADWHAAGANGFGLGSNLYRPGKRVEEIAAHARQFVSAMDDLR